MSGQDNSMTAERAEADAELTGVVESVVFRSEDTGYTVCAVKVSGRQDKVTVVGNCAAIWVGETLRAIGQWTRHRQHGTQFQAARMDCVPPTSARGIERYLASGMIRGIGKVMAKRLVAAFGPDTLKVIDKESKRLEEVDGIGPMRRERIKNSWVEQRAVRDIMIFLQGHGVGTAQSARIYRHYGGDSVMKIRENPYRLCNDIWGIGFKTADSVAMSIGVAKDSETRARAGIVYVVRTLTEEGHCYSMAPELILQAQAILDISSETLGTALNAEVERGTLIRDRDRIYLTSLYQAEQAAARRLRRLMDVPARFPPIVVEKAIPWAEDRIQLALDPSQSDALRMALAEKVSIITGGPGVGKTTIIRALVDVFAARKLKVTLAAPTGRAAKRMEEATGHEALTLHRMLKYLPHAQRFEHGPANPLEGDVFIVDEVSMVDLPLMDALLGALPDTAHAVFVGDVDQLPSVGPGNVLRDMIGSGVIPFRKLDTIFRQKSGGLIVQNAHRVNRGEDMEFPPAEENSDFYFIPVEHPDQAVQTVVDLVGTRIPRRFGFDPMTQIQVLTPMRRNQLGAENLNLVLQEALNPSGPSIQRFGRTYRVGDRVMQIRNNYDKGTYNGDIGHIVGVDLEDQELQVRFDGAPVHYEFSEIDELVHAYACSIHKSQGSEYPAVIILMTTQHFKLLQRNLLYTALTRGKRLVCLVGSKKAVFMATRNNQTLLRQTALAERLRAGGNA